MKRSILTGTALALTAAGLIAGPAQAAGPNTCVYNTTSKIVSVNLVSGGFTQLEMDGAKLTTSDAFGKSLCVSPSGVVATKTNTASVLMIGTASKEDFIVSYLGGPFSPGTQDGTDPDKIEINVLSDAQDIVDVAGTNGPDVITVAGGSGTGKQGGVTVNTGFNSTPGVKLVGDPSLVRINGLAGSDFIHGGGSFLPSSALHLRLSGGDGNDTLSGGLLGGDRLQGDGGDDDISTRDGQAGDIVSGGLGFDTASVDSNDSASGVEKFLR